MSLSIAVLTRRTENSAENCSYFNHLNAELNPICHLLALLGAHHILQVSRLRVVELVPGKYIAPVFRVNKARILSI